jgi:TolB-like protein
MKKNAKNKIWILAAIIAVIAVFSVFFYYHFFNRTEFTGKEKSIAVLPFVNINGRKADEYYSDGITENLITQLSKIEDLRVISRATLINSNISQKNFLQIGEELHVAALLTGNVKKSGNNLTINIRLVDVNSGKTIWTNVYDKDIKDIFSIQNEVVQIVARQLRAGMTEDEKNIISKRPTQSLEAYNQYQQGRYFYYKRSDSSLKVAIDYFNQAIKLDPQYSMAYSGLADSYSALGYISFELPSRAFLKAEAAAVKAIQLDSTLSEPHTSLAYIRFYYYWDWEGAEKEFLKAIQFEPRYALAYDSYCYYLTAMERFQEARVAMDKAIQLDPLSAQINTDKGFCLYYALDYDQALHSLKSTLEVYPAFPLAHVWLARVYLEKKMYKESISEYEKTLNAIKDWPVALAGIGYDYGVSGHIMEAKKMLVRLNELSASRYVTPYGVALVYASLNENDKAFEWLGKAYEERSQWMVWLKQDPRWKLIKNDPRYAELVSKVGLSKRSQPYNPQ